jgi:hypothetical protein
MAPLLLQVPITISGNTPTIGKVTFASQTAELMSKIAQDQVAAARSRLAELRRRLRLAELEYKKNATPNNFKIIEAIKAEIKSLLAAIKAGSEKLSRQRKNRFASLLKRIRQLKRLVKRASKGARKVLEDRLNKLLKTYYEMRIHDLEELIKRNRSMHHTIRRHVTSTRQLLVSIKAQEKRSTIPDGKLRQRRIMEEMKLKKHQTNLRRNNIRYSILRKKLAALKTAYARFTAKMDLKGAIGGSIEFLKKAIERHTRILNQILKRLKPMKKAHASLAMLRRQLAKAIAVYKIAIRKAKKNRSARPMMLKARRRVMDLRRRIRLLEQKYGIVHCPNLKVLTARLIKAKANYKRVMKIAGDRPSDEDAQKDRHKYEAQIKKYRLAIKRAWTCICDNAQRKMHHYERLFSKTSKRKYKLLMNKYKRQLHRCNCRAANINFYRAKKQFIKFRNRFEANNMDQNSKENMDFFYMKVIKHFRRLRMYKCKLPKLPRRVAGMQQGVFVGRRRR